MVLLLGLRYKTILLTPTKWFIFDLRSVNFKVSALPLQVKQHYELR